MWALTLLLVSLSTSESVLNKCCEQDSILRHYLVNDTWGCEPSVSPLQVRGASVQVRREYLGAMSVAAVQEVASPSYCVDKMLATNDSGIVVNTSIVALVRENYSLSDSTMNFTSPIVVNIRKCQSSDAYDLYQNISDDAIDTFIGDRACFVNVDYGLSKCGSHETVAELVFHIQHTRLLPNGSLLVHTGIESLLLRADSYCLNSLHYNSSSVTVKACQDITNVCKQRPCVQKCCSYGYGMINSKKCKPSNFSFEPTFYNVTSTDDGFQPVAVTVPTFGILSNLKCDNKYILIPEFSEGDRSYLETDGNLYFPVLDDPHLSHDMYCLERVYIPDDGLDDIYAFLCFPGDEEIEAAMSLQFTLCSVGLITSSVFLLCTFLVYACLPGLQNLHGKTLMCHVASLFAAYVCLSAAQLGTHSLNDFVCTTIGFCILFTFLAAFSWLNVMCFDIWWTFGVTRAMRQGSGSRKQREKKRFAFYSIYAWGVASAVTILTAAMDAITDLSPATVKPDMGVDYCWFSKNTYGIILYFFGPVSPMITSNLVFFVLTARNCSKVKAEIHRMQQSSIGDRCKKRYQADRNKLVMNGKLFVVMGVTWTLEIVSSLVTHPPWIWYLSDAANALQGTLIFCIFVLKRKILRTLAYRVGFRNIDTFTRPNTTERPAMCYDPYRVRKTSSNLTLCTTLTDSRSARMSTCSNR